MGPLGTVDLIGLETSVDSLDILYKSYQNFKFRCCHLLKKWLMLDCWVENQEKDSTKYNREDQKILNFNYAENYKNFLLGL